MNKPRPARSDDVSIWSYRIGSYSAPPEPQIRFFTREPPWWRDANAENKRQSVYVQFKSHQLTHLIDELSWSLEIVTEDASIDNLSSLIKRYWSLVWLVEVAAKAWDTKPSVDHFQHMLARHEIRIASLLTEKAWSVLMSQPANNVSNAIRQAMLTDYEQCVDE